MHASLSRSLVVAVSVVASVITLACGSSGGSAFGNGGSGDDGSGNGGGGGGGDFSGSGGGTPSGDVTPQSACVTSSAAGQVPPGYLVFMFDRSSSMNDASKWTSCATGLKAFFGDASTSGLNASLHFFPINTGSTTSCTETDYAQPSVAMTPLPDGAKFGPVIDAQQLIDATPTLPAINGAIDYAKQTATAHPGAKVAIVLVTDGQPNHCNSTVTTVSQAAQGVAQQIPTYVIGVGKSLTNLDAIAAAGGTNKAILVDTTSPSTIVSDFEKALGAVKAAAVGCELAMPAPPAGQTLDTNKVNVSLTAGGATSTLTYDAACASGQGWHYDNASAPTKIVMCPSTCDAVKKDPASKIQILFGCSVQGSIK